MHPRRLSAAITALGGIALLALAQFYPWATDQVHDLVIVEPYTMDADMYGADYRFGRTVYTPVNATSQAGQNGTTDASRNGMTENQTLAAGVDYTDAETLRIRWWDERVDGRDGVGRMRLAIPLFALGLVMATASAIVLLATARLVGPIIAFGTGAIVAGAMALHATGLHMFAEGALTWRPGFWFAGFAALDLVAAGVMGMVAHVQVWRFAKFEADR